MITIIVAEDHDMVREGLCSVLAKHSDFKVVDEARDGTEAIEKTERWKPNVLLLDLTLPRQHGLHVLGMLRKQKTTRVIVLTMHSDHASVLEAIRLGARGYVLKDSPSTELVKAIRAVHADEDFVSKCFEGLMRQTALNQVCGQAAEPKPVHLTNRERMILQQIAAGDATDKIAVLFGISARTVEKHRANFMRKLGLKNQRDLLLYAVRQGLLAQQVATAPLGEPLLA